MKIKSTINIYENGKKIPLKLAVKKYNNLTSHINHLRNVTKGICPLSTNCEMTSNQELKASNGNKIKIICKTYKCNY